MRLPLPVVRAGLVLQRAGLHARLPVGMSRRYLDLIARVSLVAPSGTMSEWTELSGRRTLLVRARATPRPVPRSVLYLHGGAYTVGSAASYRSMAGFLAASADADVYLPEYRLAPEHPYPAAVNDVVDGWTELVTDRGLDPASIVVGGDSAGGGLTVTSVRRVLDAGGAGPGGLMLLSPWVDIGQRSPRTRDHLVSDELGRRAARMYAGGLPLDDPGVSPTYARLDGLPPTLIHVGTDELQAPQIIDFAARLETAGVDVTVTQYDWMWHAAHIHAALLQSAVDAIGDLGQFVREKTA